MRLFVAVDLDEVTRGRLAEVQGKLAHGEADVAWVKPGNFHVTLKFLGEVEEQCVAEVGERVARAAAEVLTFSFDVEGLGRLPERGPARVIVAQVVNADQRLGRLHRQVDSGLGSMGLPLDTRQLLPHVTLGRVRSNHGINKVLRKLAQWQATFFGSCAVPAVTLYRSVPGPGGSVYEALLRAPLKHDSTAGSQASKA